MKSYKEYNNNRTGFSKRRREDDEYHTPDPVTTTHKIAHTVSKEGGEKHSRTVTISNSTKSHEEAKAVAKAHLEKQGYKIHEEVEHISEGAYEKSEENKKSADSAKKQGDMFAHHMHMADHHENLSDWHASKGRNGEADRHADKAEEHHEKAMSLKEEAQLDESMTDSWKQVQSMDKGSLTGGKEEVKKHLSYLTAVHAHHKKFGNDTKKVKNKIESINRSGIAEARMTAAMKLQKAFEREQAKTASDRKAGEELLKKPVKEDFHSKNVAKQELENKKNKGGERGIVIAALRKKAGLEETLDPSMGAGEYIKDFQKSDAPQFKGKSQEKKRMMGLAAYLQAKGKSVSEGVIQPNGSDKIETAGGSDVNGISHFVIGKNAKKKTVKEEAELTEGFVVKYHDAKGVHKNTSKVFGEKPKAEAHASKGNSIDKVGGKYTVHKIDAEGRTVKEEVQLDEATAKVETKKYSWGTMKTVHHGASFSVPLHPEHHQAIHALKDQQEHKFKDETGRHWTAKRDGENVHLHSANDGPKTTVKHSDLKEHAPIAPTIDRKYIKGTPEWKAHKEKSKPINGHPTNVKEATFDEEGNVMAEKKSYNDFVSQLLEYEVNKDGKYVHKGTYGGSYKDPEGDDDADDKKPAKLPALKRGRGRPSGAKSGANHKVTTGK